MDGDLKKFLGKFKDDISSKIYKSFSLALSKIYCGAAHMMEHPDYEDADELLQECFGKLYEDGNVDYAILTVLKSIEIAIQEAQLSGDIIRPVAEKQVALLMDLLPQTKYDTTRAKLYLLKAVLSGDRQYAEDAEIYFGKDANKNGLAEVYLHYANEFAEEEYFEKAIHMYQEAGNDIALSLVYSILASNSLMGGELQKSELFLTKATDKVAEASVFDNTI